MAKIHILVDDRERACGIIELLKGIPEASINVCRLKQGDYLINNSVCIERKTISDLATSIVDGRLFAQLAQLKAHSPHPILLIEGGTNQLIKLRMSRESIQGAIITVELIYGIPILRSFDQKESAKLIQYTAQQMLRTHDAIPTRHGYHPKKIHKQQLYILQGLPGVGKERAQVLLNHFGSVQNVFNSNIKELSQVPLIGKITAKKIHDIVHLDIKNVKP